jgi:hypothetical protein
VALARGLGEDAQVFAEAVLELEPEHGGARRILERVALQAA